MSNSPPGLSAADPLGSQLTALLQIPAPAPQAALALGRALHQARRFAEVEALTGHALRAHPAARDLWNLRGATFRMLGRPDDAIAALDRAIAVDPAFAGARINRANVLLDRGDDLGALAGFSEAAALTPADPMPRTLVGRVLARLGRPAEAVDQFRQAVTLRPDFADAWRELAAALSTLQRPAEAEAAIVEGLGSNPDNPRLLEARLLILRASGQRSQAQALLDGLALRFPQAGWVQFHLGDLKTATDPEAAIAHLRRAVELEPQEADYAFGLLQALERAPGADEGTRLDESYALALRLAKPAGQAPARTALLGDVLGRLGAVSDLEALGDFEALGRSWAEAGLHRSLLRQIGRATTPARRRELVHQHWIWGQAAEARAALAPIRRSPSAAGSKVRLGFMSSDLRIHPVGYFALSLFEHLDRSRFEVFTYSYALGEEDALQAHVRARVDGARWWPEISSRDAAQRIADDRLDMLIELGGSTSMNKLDVMAWRPAPIQASWLGYPHSSGLATIDYYICDPHNRPTAPDLMLEEPLLMPHAWIAMSPALLARTPPAAPGLPEDRSGHITFGTANSPHKFTPQVLAAWARVVAAVPGSRFAFVRPEAGSEVFRRNVAQAFAVEGVSADRIEWRAVRGAHLPHYDAIDISLDTFPLTGGTTTVEALLMGVPVVSLSGEAFYQRLSRSILINAGLGDLCVDTPEAFQATAVALAADKARRADLRANLRLRLEASPLGQTEAFARDFYDMVERAVRAGPRSAG